MNAIAMVRAAAAAQGSARAFIQPASLAELQYGFQWDGYPIEPVADLTGSLGKWDVAASSDLLTASPDSIGVTVRTGIALSTSLGRTGTYTNQDINGILGGYAWSGTTITYSFPTSGSFYGAGYPTSGGLDPSTTGFQTFSASQKASTVYALNLLSQYTGLTFTEITETASVHAMIRLAGSSAPPTSYAYYPYANFAGAGDVWLGNVRNLPSDLGTYQHAAALMHEIGHAMGLKHGQDADATYGTLPTAHNFTDYSIMDYHDYIGDVSGYEKAPGSGNQTYMVDDIAALQYLYGTNFNTNSGQTSYTWSATTGEMFVNGVGQGASTANKVFRTIWDGGGSHDLYNFSNAGYSGNMTISLVPGEWTTFSTAQLADVDGSGGHFATGNIVNALLSGGDLRSLIEDVYAGTGNDSITGNVGDNLIYGYAGNDTIRGGLGNDTAWVASLVGTTTVTLVGADHYQVAGSEGTDQLYGIERL